MDAHGVDRFQRGRRTDGRGEVHGAVAELQRGAGETGDAGRQVQERSAGPGAGRVAGAGPVHGDGRTRADRGRDAGAGAPQRRAVGRGEDGPDVGGVTDDVGRPGDRHTHATGSGDERLCAEHDGGATVQHVDADAHGVRDRRDRGRGVVVGDDLLAGVALERHAARAVLRHADTVTPASSAEAERRGHGDRGCCRPGHGGGRGQRQGQRRRRSEREGAGQHATSEIHGRAFRQALGGRARVSRVLSHQSHRGSGVTT